MVDGGFGDQRIESRLRSRHSPRRGLAGATRLDCVAAPIAAGVVSRHHNDVVENLMATWITPSSTLWTCTYSYMHE